MSNNITSTTIEADHVQIKIYVNKKKSKAKQRSKAVIRINENVYDDLATLSNETGVSICDLASEMIRFAKDKTAVIERSVRFDEDCGGRA
jgi:hypothetical protein